VLRDSVGIPHVWAESVRDLALAQGFVTAQDRLWQMELFRRVAEGRLSEVFGEATVATDRFLRTLGMARAAERQLAALSDEHRDLLNAYVAGVNAAVEAWRGPWPPEFLVLGARPEPWTATQALAIEEIMAWDLSEYRSGLDYLGAVEALGAEGAERVRRRYPPWAPTIVEDWPEGGREEWLRPAAVEEPTAAAPGEVSRAEESADGAGRSPEEGDRARLAASALPPASGLPFLEAVAVVRASNAWVVGPERSSSGKPILANDMHLALDAPNIWYLVGLHAPGLDVVGMSLPGIFGVVAGHTPSVAWGFTNAYVDDADFFVERVDPEDPDRYLTPWGSEPFESRTEVVRVKGRDAPDTVVVRHTRHGPVMTPVEPAAGGELLSLRWIAHDNSGTVGGILALNSATGVDEVVEALRDFTNPHQNVVFADTAGRWGYWMAGRVPLRRSGGPLLLPAPGWTGEHDWVGDLPFEEHPHVLEPERGFVVTANHRQTREPVGDLVTDGTWAEPYRAIRIAELIEARPLHDAESMHHIQMDVGSAFVTRHLGLAVRAFRLAGLGDLAGHLEGWDGLADVEGDEPTLFHAWLAGVRSRMRQALYRGEGNGYLPTAAVARSLVAGEVSEEILREAAQDAAGYAGTPWGAAHLLDIDHPLASVPVVGDLLGFGRSDVPSPGGPHSPNVADHGGSSPPFRVRHGPSQRHVVDLADPDGSGGFVIPGGQSGWPGARHSWDQLGLWRNGGLVPLPLSREAVEARTTSRLRLLPVGAR
jgi:penicillin amidase